MYLLLDTTYTQITIRLGFLTQKYSAPIYEVGTQELLKLEPKWFKTRVSENREEKVQILHGVSVLRRNYLFDQDVLAKLISQIAISRWKHIFCGIGFARDRYFQHQGETV